MSEHTITVQEILDKLDRKAQALRYSTAHTVKGRHKFNLKTLRKEADEVWGAYVFAYTLLGRDEWEANRQQITRIRAMIDGARYRLKKDERRAS